MHRHSTDVFFQWFLAAIWWLGAALWIWQVFRPRASQCELPLDDAPLPAPQQGPRFSMLDE
jgi:hypothetical protein